MEHPSPYNVVLGRLTLTSIQVFPKPLCLAKSTPLLALFRVRRGENLLIADLKSAAFSFVSYIKRRDIVGVANHGRAPLEITRARTIHDSSGSRAKSSVNLFRVTAYNEVYWEIDPAARSEVSRYVLRAHL